MGELYFKWSDVDFSDIYMVKYSSDAVLTGEKNISRKRIPFREVLFLMTNI